VENNSTWIGIALIGGFFLYITAKGDLPQYLSVFFGTRQASASVPLTGAEGTASNPAGNTNAIGSTLTAAGALGNAVGSIGGNQDLSSVTTDFSSLPGIESIDTGQGFDAFGGGSVAGASIDPLNVSGGSSDFGGIF